MSSLTDPSRCPACSAPLAGQTCQACGLDVAGPGGLALWELSQEVVVTMARRAELIATMRMPVRPPAPARSPYAPRGASAVAGSSVAGSSVAGSSVAAGASTLAAPLPAVPVPAVPAPRLSAPAIPAPQRPTPARTGWALQTILLVLGATLLAGAGLVFTVFAWGLLPLVARGVILAGVTAAVFAGAHRAARANLRSSAEAIAGLGSALVVLVAWVLWTAALADEVSGAVAMAGALLVAAVVLVPLGRTLTLATPSVIGLVGLTLAPAVLATWITWSPASALLLAASAALCMIGQHPLVADAPATHALAVTAPAGLGPVPAPSAPVTLRHAHTALTALAPIYLALSAFITATNLITFGAVQTLAPLAGIALVSGLWAWICAPTPSGRVWSAATGTALALLGTTGAAALPGAAPSLTLVWLLPVGAAAGVAASVGILRALPRLDASAARAGWVVFLLTGLLPGTMTVLAIVLALASTQVPHGVSGRLDVVQILAGLVVMAAAAPLLHLTGGRVVTSLAPPLLAAPFPAPGPLPTYVHLPAYPQPPAYPQFPAAPRPRSAFPAHPMGVGVVASTFLLLGLPLLMPSVVWAASTWLVLAALVSVASTRLSASTPGAGSVPVGLGGAGPEPDLVWAAARAPAPIPPERLAALVRGCAQVFCAAAVTVGTVLSFSLAAGADGSVTGDAGRAMVAASFAVAGLVLWVARSWVPEGAGNRAALLFGSLVITSVGIGILVRLVVPLTSIGWYAAPFPLLVVLVAGLARHRGAVRPLGADHLAALVAAAVLLVPGLVVGASIALTATRTDIGQPLVSSLLATALLAAAIILAWQLAFAARYPAGARLRATAGALVPVLATAILLGLRPITLALDLPLADLDWSLAVLGLLVVLITWAGSAASPAEAARLACEVAVVILAVVTTAVVVAHGDPARVSIALSICAVGALAFAVVSGRPRWGWLALGLVVCASWVSLGGTDFPPEAYTAPGGLVVVVVGAWQLVASLRAGSPLERPIRIALAGLLVLVLPTVLLAPWSSEEVRAVVVAVCVVWLGLTAQLLTMTVASRLRPLIVGLTVLGLVGAAVGLGGRAVALASQVASGSGDPGPTTQRPVLMMGLWTAAAVASTAAGAVHLARTRFPRTAPVSTRPSVLAGDPRVWAVTACMLLLTAPIGLLVTRGYFETATGWVTGGLVVGWGVAALLGTPPGAPRVRSPLEFTLRTVPALAGAYVTALLGATALSASGLGSMRPALSILLTCAGAFVAVVGVRAAQVAPSSSTWRTVSVGALATIIPTTLAMFGDPSGWWISAAIVTAAVWLVLGVSLRWQAPVACGGVALAVQAVVLAGPPALAALSGILGWVILAAVGGALLALGLTFERQITTARKVLRRYADLR
ncbi:hypothetical protein SAMN05216410_3090 [Sanguibacter gelidistatuariae]|uniref:Uncharacterized protein n=2 Tax=Sanguibacter gelidistatuariae TaxID=1814289 RepID=A0A1G6TEL7_9MICO|nr:hypothetical protein SAMN05216410_3090 [Sanguibacter gelidistatuariae]